MNDFLLAFCVAITAITPQKEKKRKRRKRRKRRGGGLEKRRKLKIGK